MRTYWQRLTLGQKEWIRFHIEHKQVDSLALQLPRPFDSLIHAQKHELKTALVWLQAGKAVLISASGYNEFAAHAAEVFPAIADLEKARADMPEANSTLNSWSNALMLKHKGQEPMTLKQIKATSRKLDVEYSEAFAKAFKRGLERDFPKP